MPLNPKPYPPDWKQKAANRRVNRAHNQCECTGQCGIHRGRRCSERHHKPGTWMRGTVRLSNAHLCQCSPPCNEDSHIIVCCQRCHLRIDTARHLHTRRVNRQLRAQAAIARIPNKTI